MLLIFDQNVLEKLGFVEKMGGPEKFRKKQNSSNWESLSSDTNHYVLPSHRVT